MSNNADVMVVGCGALGLSIALNLALSGIKVRAFDRVGPGQQTSARAAGQSVIAQTDPSMGKLMHRSIKCIIKFKERTGVSLRYHQTGSIKYAMADWSALQLGREVQRAKSLGAEVELIDLAEAEMLAPHTDVRQVAAAWYAPDDLYFHPPDMLHAYYSACVEAGVQFSFGSDVTGILTSTGKVVGIKTSEGELNAGAVVVAAGPWTAKLLHGADIGPLPLLFVRHQYSIRRGIPGIKADLPVVRVVDHAVYARPDGENLLFGTYEPVPRLINRIPDRTEQVELDTVAIDVALQKVQKIFRGLPQSQVEDMRGGVTSMTPDGRYLIDEASSASGLYFVTGCNVMGLSVSPAVGEDVASWIKSGLRPEVLSGFGISRFANDSFSDGDIRSLGLRRYESIYRDAESAGRVRSQ